MEDWTHLQDIEASESTHLSGRLVGICVSGSIACIEVHRLARNLIRHGAKVQFFLTKAATQLVSTQSLGWCTGRQPICELSARCEHLEYFGERGKADLLMLAPATANTIGKVAHGLDDNVVTTCVTTALGVGIPIMCAPGMHEPMMKNPAVVDNLDRLENLGIELLRPTLSEGKQKMMGTSEMTTRVLRRLGPGDLTGKRVLITGGPTREFFDPARCLTNPSSGLTACLLAADAYRRGAEVVLVYGPGREEPPVYVETKRVVSCEDMLHRVEEVLRKDGADILIACAAVSDFRAAEVKREKRPTALGGFDLRLETTPKIIERARELAPRTTVVSFKAASSNNDTDLLSAMRPYIDKNTADLVIGNSISIPGQGFDSKTNRYLVLSKHSDRPVSLGPDTKGRLVPQLWDQIIEFINL